MAEGVTKTYRRLYKQHLAEAVELWLTAWWTTPRSR